MFVFIGYIKHQSNIENSIDPAQQMDMFSYLL